MTIAEITVARAEAVTKLVTHLDQAAIAFKQLESLTSSLTNEVYRITHTPGSTQPHVHSLQGLDSLRNRVQMVVEHRFFAPCDDKNIDLITLIDGENKTALGVSRG